MQLFIAVWTYVDKVQTIPWVLYSKFAKRSINKSIYFTECCKIYINSARRGVASDISIIRDEKTSGNITTKKTHTHISTLFFICKTTNEILAIVSNMHSVHCDFYLYLADN